MELTVDTYRVWVQSQREQRMPKSASDVEKVIRIKQAQQACDRFKFEAMRRNITNPAFNIGL